MSASGVTQIPRGGDYFSEDPEEGGQVKSTSLVKNKWEGEDEEEDVLDSWDQEEDEKVDDPPPPPAPEKSTKKNLKKLGDKFEERDRKKREQFKEKDVEDMTPEELLEEKLRRQKLQEESDLSLAKEVFGVGAILESKEDYEKLKDEILKMVNDGIKNSHYVTFTEDLVQALCVHMSSTDIKKVHTKLGNIQIEKAKLERGDKSKKSKGKAKIRVERDDDYSEFSVYESNEYDDFI